MRAHDDSAVLDLDHERPESSTAARTSGAAPAVRLVERAVRGADQEPPVVGEELVRPPVERRSGVRAPVDVGVVATLEVDHEPFRLRSAPAQRKLRRRSRREICDGDGPLLPVAHGAYDTVNRVTTTEAAVEVRDLSKTFRTGWLRPRLQPALRGVSFAVPSGAIFGVLGPNGAGKTTL